MQGKYIVYKSILKKEIKAIFHLYNQITRLTIPCQSTNKSSIKSNTKIVNSASLHSFTHDSFSLILCWHIALNLFSNLCVHFSSVAQSCLTLQYPMDCRTPGFPVHHHWSFSFSICPSNEYSGMISFMIDCIDLPAVQGTLKCLL